MKYLSTCVNYLKNIIYNKYNFFIILILSMFIITILSVSRDFSLFKTALLYDNLTISDRFYLMSQLYPLVNSYSIFLYDLLIIFISILISLNVFMMFDAYKNKKTYNYGSYSSIIGTSITVLSIGCISCGAAVITSLLSIIGVSSILFILPYDGLEFLILSLLILVISVILNTYFINKDTCSI